MYRPRPHRFAHTVPTPTQAPPSGDGSTSVAAALRAPPPSVPSGLTLGRGSTSVAGDPPRSSPLGVRQVSPLGRTATPPCADGAPLHVHRYRSPLSPLMQQLQPIDKEARRRLEGFQVHEGDEGDEAGEDMTESDCE